MTTVATPPATTVADLVLARMSLPGQKPATPSVIRKDVGKLLGSEITAAEFDALRRELASEGFLTEGKRNTFALSETGRRRALEFLGIGELPARVNWSTLISRYLFPKAAGLSATAAAQLKDGDKLAAFILKRKYGLAAGAGATVNRALEAIACQRLGFAEETTLDGVLCAVLSRLIGSERLTKEKLVKQLPLFETGLTDATAESVRAKMVRDWLAGAQPLESSGESPPPEPLDLAAFARTVRALADDSLPRDRFHDNKVFIAALWRSSQREPSFPRLSRDEFKDLLIAANSRGLLHLSRADLVQAMDPQIVADSETAYLNATFHFVLIEEVQP
jgi:hypothetical protein